MVSNPKTPLSQKDFAEHLGVSEQAVQRWRQAGYIKSIKLGTAKSARVRIPRSELDRVLAEGLGQE